VVAGNLFRACSESVGPRTAMDSAVVGDNPDQRKEHDRAGDLKHELVVIHGMRCGAMSEAGHPPRRVICASGDLDGWSRRAAQKKLPPRRPFAEVD
jgi:hypothetical protein